MAKKLAPFKGTLTPQQVAEGINAAIRNAARLAEDSKLLLNHQRYPSAASLAVLSIEESGKLSILRHLACTDDAAKAASIWRDFRTHTSKNAMWLLPQMVAMGAHRLEDFAPLFSEESEHPHLLDNIKQIAFYTDCLGDIHWSEPSTVIDKKLASSLVEIARILTKANPVTVTEVELWVKHLRGYFQGIQNDFKQALAKWYEEMQFLGLMPAGVNAMEEFTKGKRNITD